MAATHQIRTVLDDLVFGEGPRWHDDRLWFSDMHDHRVVATTVDGDATTVVEFRDDEPSGLGWLPDGRLLMVARGMATWESCREAEVNTALIGICPSATSKCSLYPRQ